MEPRRKLRPRADRAHTHRYSPKGLRANRRHSSDDSEPWGTSGEEEEADSQSSERDSDDDEPGEQRKSTRVCETVHVAVCSLVVYESPCTFAPTC
jgi:cobalamin biosynthesis protein CobT